MTRIRRKIQDAGKKIQRFHPWNPSEPRTGTHSLISFFSYPYIDGTDEPIWKEETSTRTLNCKLWKIHRIKDLTGGHRYLISHANVCHPQTTKELVTWSNTSALLVEASITTPSTVFIPEKNNTSDVTNGRQPLDYLWVRIQRGTQNIWMGMTTLCLFCFCFCSCSCSCFALCCALLCFLLC